MATGETPRTEGISISFPSHRITKFHDRPIRGKINGPIGILNQEVGEACHAGLYVAYGIVRDCETVACEFDCWSHNR